MKSDDKKKKPYFYKCPNCGSQMGWSSDFTYEECGYIGCGLVSMYECTNCETTVEVCIPYEDSNNK